MLEQVGHAVMDGEPVTRPERVSPGDTVLVTTSGHASASCDAVCTVLEVFDRSEPVFLRLRLTDGREFFYVPSPDW